MYSISLIKQSNLFLHFFSTLWKNSKKILERKDHNLPHVTRVVIPFKDQDSADIVKVQMKDLSLKLQTTILKKFLILQTIDCSRVFIR